MPSLRVPLDPFKLAFDVDLHALIHGALVSHQYNKVINHFEFNLQGFRTRRRLSCRVGVEELLPANLVATRAFLSFPCS